MKTLTECVATSIFCAGLFAVFTAGPAAANVDDVTLAASVSGSTVTTTITNATEEGVVCGVVGLDAVDDVTNPESVAIFRAANEDIGPGSRDFVFADVPDGDYLVHWICRDNDGPEEGVWGSSPLPEAAYALTATAQPLPLRVSTET
ncbi:hypothetical protein [Rhodococcus sp. NPDC049939]|uniref:hypothetical protein n=1 Tax=Rhodococcus sp. NPDC049939 TaxID=3155511 RepID=UPI0033EB2DCD